MFACGAEVLRVAETLILVLPTDIEDGEWKERRFAAPQREKMVWNMTQSEQDVLCKWGHLLDTYSRSYIAVDSFEEMASKLVNLWEQTKSKKGLSGETVWVDWKIPEVRVMELRPFYM